MLLACSRIKDYDESMLMCIDYIISSTEYEDFYRLIMDFKVSYDICYSIFYNISNISLLY